VVFHDNILYTGNPFRDRNPIDWYKPLCKYLAHTPYYFGLIGQYYFHSYPNAGHFLFCRHRCQCEGVHPDQPRDRRQVLQRNPGYKTQVISTNAYGHHTIYGNGNSGWRFLSSVKFVFKIDYFSSLKL